MVKLSFLEIINQKNKNNMHTCTETQRGENTDETIM